MPEAGRSSEAPAPVVATEGTADAIRYWDGLRAGRLLYQRCRDCGAARHPAGTLCVACLSPRLEWLESSGRGTVYSLTRVPTPGAGADVLAAVTVAEGFALITRIVGAGRDAAAVGTPVVARFERGDAGVLPVFEPDPAGAA